MAIKFVDVKYKGIFDNINLEIKENEITSIVGKNGSGKTNFLNLIFGLDLNFFGKIVVNRKNIELKISNKKIEQIRKSTAYLSQDYKKELFNINIFEDLKYGVSNFDENRLAELLKLFSLNKEILNKNYFDLSDGEIKKILLIGIFIKDSKIILLDDPTSGLDSKSIENLVKLLKKEKRNNKIILIASQNSEFLFSVSDKILIINDSKIIEQDNKYKFFENKFNLNKCGLNIPNILNFRETTLKKKGIKLAYRDNINDLIKDIYRSAK